MTVERTMLLAAPRSFCAGVERAVEIVELALRKHGAPVYVRRQIVHNEHVVAELERAGAVFVQELSEAPRGAAVVFAAHGVSPEVRAEAEERELTVVDATCPLVSKVHAEARRFAARGDTVILIGHDGHEEVEGTLGEAPGTLLVESVADAETVSPPDPERVSCLTQTTLSVNDTEEVLAVLRRRFPRLRGPAAADICYATSNRQQAVIAVAAEVELMLVVGADNSSNSRRLVETAASCGVDAHLLADASQLNPDWLEGVRTVGLTAGASAPPHLVREVLDRVADFGPLAVRERSVAVETVNFGLPSELRDVAEA